MQISNTAIKQAFLSNRFRIAILWLSTGISCLLITYFASTSMYEASGVVRIGQAPHSESEDNLVMPPIETLELISQPAYRKDIIDPIAADRDPNYFSYRARLLHGPYIKIYARAPSTEYAVTLLNKAIDKLVKDHKPIYDHRLSVFARENQIRPNTKLLYEQGQQVLGELLKEGNTLTVEELTKLIQVDRYVDKVIKQRNLTDKLLNSKSVYPTALFGGVSVSNSPVYPSWLLLIIFSTFIGGIFAVIYLGWAAYALQKQAVPSSK